MRAALIGRCGADTVAPAINRAAVEVLQRNGVEVIDIPSGCCGALAHHGGETQRALASIVDNSRRLAAALTNGEIDVVVTTAAGCGAQVADYGRLAASAAPQDAEAAELVSQNSRDICEMLVDIDFEKPHIPATDRKRVAYHDACHLVHACGITDAPRQVCEAATGVTPIDLGENDLCCGSAGRYNLDQPAMATKLGARKAELADQTAVDTVAVANVGCVLQISRAIAMAGGKAKVAHPIELLADAYLKSNQNQSG